MHCNITGIRAFNLTKTYLQTYLNHKQSLFDNVHRVLPDNDFWNDFTIVYEFN